MQELLLALERRIKTYLDEREQSVKKTYDDYYAQTNAKLDTILSLLDWKEKD